ncbi:aldo/keto reductase [Histidinibacterium aquaticum]|uniref:Aldo/keto reductase n=1 Tax=Histidinibacterium aquaticum TaxID=2613962 RepID=A0A5J5GAY9_9RHOB|nr:aldo/keto reductase [Histidinibacterium aquaticum]KAA9005275.1 aldo/keto reductase [Histidinibacterium aquaticum]
MLDAIPQIGFGTWQRRGDEATTTVRAAIECGYRHIDTAQAYGNEAEVGKGIADSGIARDDLWVTTKIQPSDLGPGQVRPKTEESLEKLGLEQLDLLLVHWPAVDGQYEMEDYLGQFMEVQDAGLTRKIGVSNFTIAYIDQALSILGDRELTTNQVELHPFLRNGPIVEHCKSKGIPLTAYSPLARGEIAEDAVIKSIAGELEATEAQVVLAWLMAKGIIVIPTSSKSERIEANLKATEIQLTSKQMMTMDGLHRNERLISGPHAPEWDEE